MLRAPANWPVWRKEELLRNQKNAVIGTKLLLETPDLRLWLVEIAPGKRLPFHLHVLNHVWTANSNGRIREHAADGAVTERKLNKGEAMAISIGEGEGLLNDLENIGETPVSMTFVELKTGSPNKPLPLGPQRGWT